MKRPPLVSIIVPVKGRFELVKNALHSIYSQQNISLADLEIILVEEKNYGENISSKIKKLFPKVITLHNQDDKGPGGSRNTGLKMAHGKYIIFLDSDDQLKPFFITLMLKTLGDHKDCSAVVCLSDTYFDPNFNLRQRLKLYPLILIRDSCFILFTIFNKGYLSRSAFYLCQISHMMFKAEIVKKLRFNYDYRRGGEDWDFFVQAMKKGPIKIVPKRLLTFGYYPGSSTDTPFNQKLKWQSYLALANSLPVYFRKSIYYRLFLKYIELFKH